MSKKMLIGIVSMILSITVALVLAQPGAVGPGGRGDQPRMGPPGGPMGQWFDDLERAYEQKDMDKIGELIGQMKERRAQFQGRADRIGPGGPPEGMGGPGRGRFAPGGADESALASQPMPKDEAEKKVLSVLDDMDRNQRRGMMNVPVADGRLLRLLTETVNAKHVVEIGTSNGYSAIWFCLALQKTGGKLTTHEIDAHRASLARENFKRAGVDKLVTLVEGDAHEEVTKLKEPIDILFLDADKEGYIDYLNKLLPLVRAGGLVVAHNISPRQGDPRYIKAITTNPDLETVLYQQGAGVSVTLKKR
jgi:caffeoyl-CoA O-methyltransferase